MRDATLTIPRADDPTTKDTIYVKKGTSISGDIVGLCAYAFHNFVSKIRRSKCLPAYDSQVFPDPECFNPRRWLDGESDRRASSLTDLKQADEDPLRGFADTMDGFMNFSSGPRMCIGHKFTKIEAVAFLTHLRSWQIEPILKAGETPKKWQARVLEPTFKLTLSFGDVPVRFVRRPA